jgi:DNA-binding MarR family transcriptional regulator
MTMQAADRESWQQPLAGPQRELLGAHLLLLGRLLRRQARADLAPFAPQGDMQQRLLLAMGVADMGRVSDLTMLLGADMAQVSRAFRELASLELVTRQTARGPYELTPAGAREAEAMLAVLREQEQVLLAGMGTDAVAALRRNIALLHEKATAVLLAANRGEAADEPAACTGSGVPDMPAQAPLQFAIISLASIISRSATIIYKRRTGLSGYEWRVLANVAARPGIGFPDLVIHIGSDKGQVSRAVASMVASGYLKREKAGRGMPQAITLTARGEDVYAVLLEDGYRRNVVMLAQLPPGESEGLMASLTRVIANTQAPAPPD